MFLNTTAVDPITASNNRRSGLVVVMLIVLLLVFFSISFREPINNPQVPWGEPKLEPPSEETPVYRLHLFPRETDQNNDPWNNKGKPPAVKYDTP
jgi:hypothetical protein